MSSLPGLVACGFLMGRIGRINMLCGGLFTAMIFSLFLPLSLSAEAALLAILCLFAGKLYESYHIYGMTSDPRTAPDRVGPRFSLILQPTGPGP